MGEKDYQQLYLVKKFIEKKYKSKIIGCNTIRAKNKYALSSRNFLLKNIELDKAGKIAKLLINFKKKLIKKENIQSLHHNFFQFLISLMIEFFEYFLF